MSDFAHDSTGCPLSFTPTVWKPHPLNRGPGAKSGAASSTILIEDNGGCAYWVKASVSEEGPLNGIGCLMASVLVIASGLLDAIAKANGGVLRFRQDGFVAALRRLKLLGLVLVARPLGQRIVHVDDPLFVKNMTGGHKGLRQFVHR